MHTQVVRPRRGREAEARADAIKPAGTRLSPSTLIGSPLCANARNALAQAMPFLPISADCGPLMSRHGSPAAERSNRCTRASLVVMPSDVTSTRRRAEAKGSGQDWAKTGWGMIKNAAAIAR
jgi:hypothetical protein